jgi:mitochondrial fission protein ELM1
VFLGERKPYPSEWFHTVFTPSSAERGSNDVPIDIIPTQVTPAIVEIASKNWSQRPAGPLWTMVIGGSSASHHYSEADWDHLAAGMSHIASGNQIRWLLTTSRRTGKDAERQLKMRLAPDMLAECVWWSTNPEKKMRAYLGAADRVFVTQDSITMITEAVASARPVYVLRPKIVRFRRDSFLPHYIENLAATGRIQVIAMADLASSPLSNELSPRDQPVNREIAASLIERLKWRV